MRFAALALSIAACGSTSNTGDAGRDDAAGSSGSDVGVVLDVGADAGRDVGTDAASPPVRTFVYVGLATGDLVTLDGVTLVELSRTHTGDFPSFVTGTADGTHLYVVNENANEVASLDVTAAGVATVTHRQPAAGGPTHIAIDHAEQLVFAAAYGSGHVFVFRVGAGGALTTAAVTDEATCGAHAHEVVVAPGDARIYVPCLGDDTVVVRELSGTGALSPSSLMHTAAQAGPRHVAFSHDGRFAYVIDETASTLDVASVDATSGALTPLQTITTLPAGFTGTNACAEVLVSQGDRFVYASNRGHDSVAVFARDAGTGRVTLVEHEPAGGMHPRSMTLTRDGAHLYVADRDSNLIAVLAVAADGTLSPARTIPMPGMPYFVGELVAPAP